MDKAILLMIDYPQNWLGQCSQFMNPLVDQGSDSLSFVLERCQSSEFPVLVSLWINAKLNSEQSEVLRNLQERLSQAQISTTVLKQDSQTATELHRLAQTFEDYPALQAILKVRPEDFFSPTPQSLDALKELGEEDYTFSINEPVGMNFEIFSRICVEKLMQLEKADDRPQMVICRDCVDDFSRKRYSAGYIDEDQPHYRFTLDSSEATQNLRNFLRVGSRLEPESLMDWSQTQKCFLRFFDEPFYNHRTHFDPKEFSNQYIVQFFERGLFGKRYMKRDCKVLDLCCGSMFLAEFFYSTGSSNIVCMDDCEDARELYKSLHLEEKGIQFLKGSILRMQDWDKVNELGAFDVVTWTAAIEHFSLEDQGWILERISQVLKPGGVLLGDTVVFSPQGLPGHWQHKNEITSKEDLDLLLQPYFAKVDTFITFYEEMTFQPIYFVATK
jgi:2-polyprenyl-3-methyl-5-hydroxy-6-metoxy-1,4-benzoquinol methylase